MQSWCELKILCDKIYQKNTIHIRSTYIYSVVCLNVVRSYSIVLMHYKPTT